MQSDGDKAVSRFKPDDEVFCEGLAWGCGTVIEANNPYIMLVDFGRYGIRPLSITDQWRLATEEDKRWLVVPVPEPEPMCEPEEATLENLEDAVSRWERSVSYFDTDFDCSDEYTHDLSMRECLHDVLNRFEAQCLAVSDVLKARVDAADKRFVELTVEVEHPVLGRGERYDKETFWYYYRWPIK